jgi:hypothetical protein
MTTPHPVVAQDGDMTSPIAAVEPSDVRSEPNHHQHHHLPDPNPLVTVVLAGCAYEVTARGVNAWLGEDALPLLSNGIKAFTWGAVGRRLVPPWALPAGLVAVGFVLTVAVVGPRARRRKIRDSFAGGSRS